MYADRIAERGMFAFKFEYDALMFESISHFEHLDFGLLEHLTNVDWKKVPWKLDFPYKANENFPDLKRSMAPLNLDVLYDYSEFSFSSSVILSSCWFPVVNSYSFCPFSDSDLYDYLMKANHPVRFHDPVKPKALQKKAAAAAILRAASAGKVGAASSIDVFESAGSLTIVTGKTKKEKRQAFKALLAATMKVYHKLSLKTNFPWALMLWLARQLPKRFCWQAATETPWYIGPI